MSTELTSTELTVAEPATEMAHSSNHEASNELLYTPRIDVVDTGDELVLYADMPGVSADNFDIRFEQRELKIQGKVTPRYGDTNLLFSEYGTGDFFRSFFVGESIDANGITAELKDGVLMLRLPKAEEAKCRKIEVTAS